MGNPESEKVEVIVHDEETLIQIDEKVYYKENTHPFIWKIVKKLRGEVDLKISTLLDEAMESAGFLSLEGSSCFVDKDEEGEVEKILKETRVLLIRSSQGSYFQRIVLGMKEGVAKLLG